jgi:hypothetical protein
MSQKFIHVIFLDANKTIFQSINILVVYFAIKMVAPIQEVAKLFGLI